MGFAIQISIACTLDWIPKEINEHLTVLCLNLTSACHIAVFSTYAPMITCLGNVKEKFYKDFNTITKYSHCCCCDKLIILGDFNITVGCTHEAWPKVIDKQGVGKENSNGTVLTKRTENQLVITNMIFQPAMKSKTT